MAFDTAIAVRLANKWRQKLNPLEKVQCLAGHANPRTTRHAEYCREDFRVKL